jgi:gas vesicle protein
MEMMKIERIAWGMTCGVLVGGIVGLLLAPQPGREYWNALHANLDRVKAGVKGNRARNEETAGSGEGL